MIYDEKTLKVAIKAAAKKIPMLSVKQRNENLDMAAADMAEAYEIGVEEAQHEIILRLEGLLAK